MLMWEQESGSVDTSKVSFNFKPGMAFEETGGPSNYPAICGGTYQHYKHTLAVNDTCVWTANFDHTLIFDGNFNITFSGVNAVRIWRTDGAVTDEYLLTAVLR